MQRAVSDSKWILNKVIVYILFTCKNKVFIFIFCIVLKSRKKNYDG